MKSPLTILCALCFAVFLTGCATRPTVIPPVSFTEQPKKILIAHLSSFKNANYIPPGNITNYGLLGALVDCAMIAGAADVGPAVHRLVSAPLVDEHYSKRFDSFYQGHDFTITLADNPINKNQLYPCKAKNETYAPYDFTYLKDQYQVDYALILDITQFCAIRFGYLAKPHGRSTVKGYLVNLSDNSIIGEYATQESIVYPKGEWDTPPHFYALTQSVRESLKQSLDQIYTVFAKGKLPKKS